MSRVIGLFFVFNSGTPLSPFDGTSAEKRFVCTFVFLGELLRVSGLMWAHRDLRLLLRPKAYSDQSVVHCVKEMFTVSPRRVCACACVCVCVCV